MTTQAQAFEALGNKRGAADITQMIEAFAIAKDQDWENETTIYTFDDNSVLHDQNGNYTAVEIKEAA